MGAWRGNYKFDSGVVNHRRDFQAESSFQEKNTSAMGKGWDKGGGGGFRRRDIFANKPREARQGRREICNLGASGWPVAVTHSSRVESVEHF